LPSGAACVHDIEQTLIREGLIEPLDKQGRVYRVVDPDKLAYSPKA